LVGDLAKFRINKDVLVRFLVGLDPCETVGSRRETRLAAEPALRMYGRAGDDPVALRREARTVENQIEDTARAGDGGRFAVLMT
jgi:hypothetical protein